MPECPSTRFDSSLTSASHRCESLLSRYAGGLAADGVFEGVWRAFALGKNDILDEIHVPDRPDCHVTKRGSDEFALHEGLELVANTQFLEVGLAAGKRYPAFIVEVELFFDLVNAVLVLAFLSFGIDYLEVVLDSHFFFPSFFLQSPSLSLFL